MAEAAPLALKSIFRKEYSKRSGIWRSRQQNPYPCPGYAGSSLIVGKMMERSNRGIYRGSAHSKRRILLCFNFVF